MKVGVQYVATVVAVGALIVMAIAALQVAEASQRSADAVEDQMELLTELNVFADQSVCVAAVDFLVGLTDARSRAWALRGPEFNGLTTESINGLQGEYDDIGASYTDLCAADQ